MDFLTRGDMHYGLLPEYGVADFSKHFLNLVEVTDFITRAYQKSCLTYIPSKHRLPLMRADLEYLGW